MRRTNVAILAKAPIPGLTKTRLIPSIGAHAAAKLQEAMTERTVATAIAATIGPVTLWCAPDPSHGSFRELAAQHKIALKRQPDGDLGLRMLATFAGGPTLVVGSDCPALKPEHFEAAAKALSDFNAVLIPAEDGGYVLIGARAAHTELFSGMTWSTSSVLAETRTRLSTLGLRSLELPPLWDVDTDDDLLRLECELPELNP
jgi:rSAM/selenodomain-associated transferase 1